MSDTIKRTTVTGATGRANWIHFLFSGTILLGSMAFYETSQAEALRREVGQLQRDNSVLRTNLSTSDHTVQRTLAAFQGELDQFHTELISARTETQT